MFYKKRELFKEAKRVNCLKEVQILCRTNFPKYYKFWKYPFMDKGFYVLIFYPQLDYIFSDRPDTYVCRGYGGEEIYIKKHDLKKEYDLVIDLSGKVLDHTKY